ncbi:hypothetical protein A2696_01340 [Candidatus Curtissbacteria bacterium RIFCSPHIGHO2_01_FULL_41_13]|uniref:PIN domain-containing protein n=1 Tax=Candidatus Curtissbacteria bacterium RIFCSPHIGHO2_01_FULL_41_13 TaxID=1797745 RepID=A0A1F5FXZ0_9BACT|nr:MAG: hypothetical protein A2696_01340 [Candidatus Curtissbacteria bacterium RIFCSPHIGHO2_01_FULL_41_13]
MWLLIDSSVFVAFFKKDDIFHKVSVKFIERLSQKSDVVIVVPIIVFLETANILNKKPSKFNSRLILDIFNRYETVNLTFGDANLIIGVFQIINLKTSDAIVVSVAKLTDTTLITWDQKLQKEARKIVETFTPQEFLKKF